MTSVRENCLAKLFEKLLTIESETISVYRNRVELTEPSGDGFINVVDGVSGEPDIIMSPTIYIYEHIAEIMVVVKHKDEQTRLTKIEGLLSLINGVILANDTLDGVCDYLRAEAPEINNDYTNGAVTLKYATIPVIIRYHTTSPLG